MDIDIKNYVVYKFYDSNSSLIYVGITKNIKTRVKQHRRYKKWFKEVSEIYISPKFTRNEAHIYEIYYIGNQKPKYNIDFKDGGFVEFQLPEIIFKEMKMSLKRHKEITIPIIESLYQNGHDIEYISDKLQLSEQMIKRRLIELGLINKNIKNVCTLDEKISILDRVINILSKENTYFTDEDIKEKFSRIYKCSLERAEKIIYREKQIKKSLNEIILSYGLKRIRCNKIIKKQYGVISNGYPFIIIRE